MAAGANDASAPVPHAGAHASVRDLLRLWPWLRPYRGYLVFMLVVATLAMVVQSVLPLITAALIDGPIARHQDIRDVPVDRPGAVVRGCWRRCCSASAGGP